MNYLLILTVFLAVVFASQTQTNYPFEALAPTNEKAKVEFKTNAEIVSTKKTEIMACQAKADFADFKTCISAIENLPKLFVDTFPADNYKEEISIENAMKAYAAALKNKHENVTLSHSNEKDKDTLFGKVTDVLFYCMFSAVGVFVIIGFVSIVYAYFIKKNDNSDL